MKSVTMVLVFMLMLALVASANIRLAPGGHIWLGEGGRILVRGVNPAPPAVPELLTPVMTSNTAPSPNSCTGIFMDPITSYYLAFDQNASTNVNNGAMPMTNFGDIRFDFSSGTTHLVTSLGIECESGYVIGSFTLGGSNNNGSSFVTLFTGNMENNDTMQEFAIATTTRYAAYKIAWTNVYRVDNKMRVEEIELRGLP